MSFFKRQSKTDPQEQTEEEKNRADLEIAGNSIEALYQMSTSGDTDEQKMNDYLSNIADWNIFSRCVVKEGDGNPTPASLFYEALPVLNKLIRTDQNLDSMIHRISPISGLVKTGRSALKCGLEVVNEEVLSQLDAKRAEDLLESAEILLHSKDDSEIDAALKFLTNRKDYLVSLASQRGLPEMNKKIASLEEFLASPEFDSILTFAVDKGLYEREQTDESKIEILFCKDAFYAVLQKYGFESEQIINDWCDRVPNEKGRVEPNVFLNMKKVLEIEKDRPGITKLLHKEFGIRNFHRYSEDILQSQFDDLNNTEKPYGIMIQAVKDPNSALWDVVSNSSVERFFEQIKDKYALRICEADGRREVAEHLIKFNKRYGDSRKISFAFIVAHGVKDGIFFGGPENGQMLKMEDLAGKGAGRVNNFFEPHPTIILISCSTGAEGGIAQEISKKLGAKVIAPKTPVALEGISADTSGPEIKIDVQFIDLDKKTDKGNTYLDGEKT